MIYATVVNQDIPGQNMMALSQTYSSFKNSHTFQSVTGASVIYVSKLYQEVHVLQTGPSLNAVMCSLNWNQVTWFLRIEDLQFTLSFQQAFISVFPSFKKKQRTIRHRTDVQKNCQITHSHIPYSLWHLSTEIVQVCSILVKNSRSRNGWDCREIY